MDEIEVDVEDISETFNEAAARASEGTRVPGMSYEEGVRDALGWVLGQVEDNPFYEGD